MQSQKIENIASKDLSQPVPLARLGPGSAVLAPSVETVTQYERNQRMRTKLGLLGLCAVVVGIMSMSAGAAQGATLSWLILNSAGTEAKELKAELIGEKDSTHLTLDGEIAGLKVAITCTNFTLSGVNLEAGGTLTTGGKVVFTGCGVYHSAPLTEPFKECEVKTAGTAFGTIETGKGKGKLELVGTKLLTRIEPEAGSTGTFASLQFNETCVLTSPSVVHGTLFLEDCEGLATTHALKHLVQADQTNSALYVGGHSTKQLEVTKLLGSGWILLTGAHKGLKFSAMDV
jgi:hypothetical protein